ncbi:MAG: metal-dependent transcriptional regulator [Lachnospiraceae bacterium]|nr:metal-dependent transcriptional regulator [Lachnospiraceae bacterium]
MNDTEKNGSAEDYLKSILMIQEQNGFARSVDVARALGVTRPSVCNAMKRLREKDLIYIGEKGHILFTDTGKAIAEKIHRKHMLLKEALIRIGVSEQTAAEEACRIEHVIGDETYACLSAKLGG